MEENFIISTSSQSRDLGVFFCCFVFLVFSFLHIFWPNVMILNSTNIYFLGGKKKLSAYIYADLSLLHFLL